MRSYELPYCSKCSKIYRRSQAGIQCPVCGRWLGWKTFRPLWTAVAAVAAPAFALLTIIVGSIPVIWVGGFLAGITLGIRAHQQSETFGRLYRS